jgi:hypothetical protein
VDAASPVYDPATKNVYFTLGRFDRTTIKAPDYQLACPTTKALLGIVDTATDTLTSTVDLPHQNPVDVLLDASKNRLLVLSGGCFQSTDAGSTRVAHGIASYDLKTGSTQVLLSPKNDDYLARFIQLDASTVIVDTFDSSFGEHWYEWDPSSTTFGAELTGVPGAPSGETATTLLGVNLTPGEAGTLAELVRYDIGTMQSISVFASPFSGDFMAAGGTALVR